MVEVLMVDDNPADVDLAREALVESSPWLQFESVLDGDAAVSSLLARGKYGDTALPDLLLLDLNLPGKDGHGVLAEIKASSALARIPVVVFTTSAANADVLRSFDLGANCYVRKPGTLAEYFATVQAICNFWLGHAAPQESS